MTLSGMGLKCCHRNWWSEQRDGCKSTKNDIKRVRKNPPIPRRDGGDLKSTGSSAILMERRSNKVQGEDLVMLCEIIGENSLLQLRVGLVGHFLLSM